MAPLIDQFRAAQRDKHFAVLEGFHAVKHAIRFGAVLDVLVVGDAGLVDRLAEELAPDVADEIRARAVVVNQPIFATLSPHPPETMIIGVARRSQADISRMISDDDAPLVVLDEPSHPGNVGAVIRVAAATSCRGVLTLGSLDPWTPAAIRGSAGLHFAQPVARGEATQMQGISYVAIDPGGDEVTSLPRNSVLVFGSERRGVSADLLRGATRRVRIPMRAGVSSLNLATAVAATLYGSIAR